MHIRKILEDTSDKIWDNKNHKCFTEDDDKEVEFAIVFGDPRGDKYIEEFDGDEEFTKGLQNHIVEGNTGCDFPTKVYHIIKNGEEYKPRIS